jgi:hypothetical protein
MSGLAASAMDGEGDVGVGGLPPELGEQTQADALNFLSMLGEKGDITPSQCVPCS